MLHKRITYIDDYKITAYYNDGTYTNRLVRQFSRKIRHRYNKSKPNTRKDYVRGRNYHSE